MPTIVVSLDEKFRIVKEVQSDDRGRLTIGQEVVGVQRYRVLVNAAGQILLDPVVSIPARELWLFKNHEAFASVARGVEQARRGQVESLGSFAQFDDDDDGEQDSE